MGCVDIVSDPDDKGEPCGGFVYEQSVDSCADQQVCWGGLCRPLCTGDIEAQEWECPEEYYCTFYSPIYPLCTYICNPLVDDCPLGEYCHRDGLMVCTGAGPATGLFGSCSNEYECPVGQFCAPKETAAECADLEGTSCCVEFCDLDAPLCSGAGQECIAYYPEDMAPVPKLENLGFCTLP